jgi:hypothetical protein
MEYVMKSRSFKSKVIEIIDRRTVVCLVTLFILFLLAYKGESKAAIDAIETVSIALFGANAFQKSAQAFAKKSQPEKSE